MNKLLEKYLMPLRAPEAEGGAPAAAPAGDAPAGDVAPVETLLGGDGDVGDDAGDLDPAGGAGDGEGEPAEYVDDPALTPEENATKKTEFEAAKAEKAKTKDEPVDPASYVINLGEGESLDPVVEKEFRDYAASKKLSQKDIDTLTGMQRKVQAEGMKRLAENVEKWGKEIRSDKEIGGPDFKANTAAARLAIKTFFPPTMTAVFNQTGLGSYPDFVKGMVRIGKLMGENGVMPGGATSDRESAVDILYGKPAS